jgi:Family of unknown function (DUF6055)
MRVAWKPIGVTIASIVALALLPSTAAAGDQWAFRAPAARPTDHPDPNRHAYGVPQAPESPSCTPHFCVHWVVEGRDAPQLTDLDGIADGDGVPDFVEQVEEVAEHVYEVENEKLGWRDPRSDGREGGALGKTDVYLAEIGGSLFGYAAPDRGQAGRERRLPRHLHGYLVLDNDYDPFEFPGTKPLEDLQVTFAHEYSHILQFGYDAYQDAWFAESTAVWMEDQVYNGINDYLRYVRRWTRLYDTPITATAIREYGSAVWNQWLARRYGRSIIRRAWAEAIHVKPGGFSVAAYDRAIRAAGGSDFNRDFALFCRDVAEWRTDEVFREGDLYLDVPRQGGLSTAGAAKTRTLNHTTFQLLRVDARGGRAVDIDVTAPAGGAAGVALVGRIGSEERGHVVSRITFKRNGGRLSVSLGRPGRFDRITAVLINADTSAFGFSARRFDWNYLTDTAPFRARARLVR